MISRRIPATLLPGTALALLLAAGCKGTVLPTFAPYRMDVQQGNYVTQEMIAKVRPGMSPSQVRFALGTPLIMDPFHKDRWDYVFLYQKAGEVTEHRRIVVVFRDDKLLRIEGDVVPAPSSGSSRGAAAPAAAARGPAERKETGKAAP